jgi:hypothetical protein
MIKAALFDLDGVVLDTERQYTKFWGGQMRRYHPEIPGLEHKIKGMTLHQIFDAYFFDQPERREAITRALDDFERAMTFSYIPGFEAFVAQLKNLDIRTALVTSSNLSKMKSVYKKLPELPRHFDRILTSEDFARSKPHPDCYLRAAAAFGAEPGDCVGFEDSLNGLRAVRAAGLYAVALTTTNGRDVVRPLSDRVVDDFTQLDANELSRAASRQP